MVISNTVDITIEHFLYDVLLLLSLIQYL